MPLPTRAGSSGSTRPALKMTDLLVNIMPRQTAHGLHLHRSP